MLLFIIFSQRFFFVSRLSIRNFANDNIWYRKKVLRTFGKAVDFHWASINGALTHTNQ